MRLPNGSGVSREAPAPFCEGLGGKFPRSTHHEFHWHLDVTMKEDESDIGATANKNLRVARTIALNLLREDHSYKRGLRAKMRRCHRSEAYLDQVLSAGNF